LPARGRCNAPRLGFAVGASAGYFLALVRRPCPGSVRTPVGPGHADARQRLGPWFRRFGSIPVLQPSGSVNRGPRFPSSQGSRSASLWARCFSPWYLPNKRCAGHPPPAVDAKGWADLGQVRALRRGDVIRHIVLARPYPRRWVGVRQSLFFGRLESRWGRRRANQRRDYRGLGFHDQPGAAVVPARPDVDRRGARWCTAWLGLSPYAVVPASWRGGRLAWSPRASWRLATRRWPLVRGPVPRLRQSARVRRPRPSTNLGRRLAVAIDLATAGFGKVPTPLLRALWPDQRTSDRSTGEFAVAGRRWRGVPRSPAGLCARESACPATWRSRAVRVAGIPTRCAAPRVRAATSRPGPGPRRKRRWPWRRLSGGGQRVCPWPGPAGAGTGPLPLLGSNEPVSGSAGPR